MGETYGVYTWPVTPYFMASFPVCSTEDSPDLLDIFTDYKFKV